MGVNGPSNSDAKKIVQKAGLEPDGNLERASYFAKKSVRESISEFFNSKMNNAENMPTPYSVDGWNQLSAEEQAEILNKRETIKGYGVERIGTYAATSVENTNDKESPKTEEEQKSEEPAKDEPKQETPKEYKAPANAGKPERYKGENKPATTADWAKLENQHFEAIDQPNDNGVTPTRPIHGRLSIPEEVKDGENPKKLIISDKDNGREYTFELDTSVKDKVVYKCTQGPGGAYKKGNDYELRTINGVPMLVQMHESEGHGLAVGKAKAKEEAPKVDETDETTETEETAETEETTETEETAETEETSETEETTEAEETPKDEEKEQNINDDEAYIALHARSVKGYDENLVKDVADIRVARVNAEKLAPKLADALSKEWTGIGAVAKALIAITPKEMPHVLADIPNIAEKIDDVFGLSKETVYDSVISVLQARVKELGLKELVFDNGEQLSKDTSLGNMQNWITATVKQILEKEKSMEAIYNNQREAYKEFEEFEKKHSKTYIAANRTLAEAANAEPKLEPTINEEQKSAFVTLPDCRMVAIQRDDDGNIIKVSIDKDSSTDGNPVPDVMYEANTISFNTDPDNKGWEATYQDQNWHDFNAILELVNRIFEKPKKEEKPEE